MVEKKLPKDWKWVKLGQVCEIVYGKGLPTKNLKQKGFPVFGANGIIGFNDKYLYEDPMVLISCRGAYSGKINLSPSKCFITNNSLVLNVKNKKELDEKYLYYSLTAAHKTKLVTGTAQPQVTINNAVELDIPLPSIPTQQTIVSKIEELFSELDKGIENLRLAQQQLKTYRQAVLKWAFEGRLTNENVKDGELPEGWKLLKLKDITLDKEGLRRGPFGSAIKKEFFVMNGYKVYEQGNAINDDPYRGHYYVSEEKYNELKNFKVSPHDLIVSCSGVTLGRICELPNDMQPGIINQALLRIRLKRDKILTRYFVIYFRSAFFQKKIFDQSQGTAMPNLIGIKDFKEIEMLVPTIEKQNKIVQEIESRHRVADKLEESITQSLQQAEALRQSILKKAFEGRLIS